MAVLTGIDADTVGGFMVAVGRDPAVRGRRMYDPGRGSGAPATLADISPGLQATVAGVSPRADPAVARRLQQLGFRTATRVEVIRRAPLGDPTIYRVRDAELCIRRSDALLIEVVEDVGR